MRRVGQARKRDANEKAIVSALEAAGCVVLRVSGVGVPDLFVWHPRVGWQPLEVKAPKGKLTQAQMVQLAPFHVVRSEAEALALFGVQG